MKKDYETVTTAVAHENEDTFVENYWTSKWEAIGRTPKAEWVRARPEYRVMRRYLKQLPKGSQLLDGGCGMGEWTVELTNEGFDVTGLDLSRRTIDLLQKQLPKYRFASGDIRHTGFSDSSFDGYFSWGVFEHFENGLGECIEEARRILKPDGLLFISVPYHNWRHMLRDTWSRARQPTDTALYRFYQWRLTRGELRDELSMRGFHVEKVLPIHKLSGAERLIHGVTGWRWRSEWPVWRKGLYRGSQYAVSSFLPAAYLSHMVMAVARKSR